MKKIIKKGYGYLGIGQWGQEYLENGDVVLYDHIGPEIMATNIMDRVCWSIVANKLEAGEPLCHHYGEFEENMKVFSKLYEVEKETGDEFILVLKKINK